MLAEFLPPKQEFVIAVRITPLQYKLYRYYLDHITGENLSARFCRVSAWSFCPDGCFSCLPAVSSMAANVRVRTSANLFKDFQVLSQIWNHPWCLQLNWEKKVWENPFWFYFLSQNVVILTKPWLQEKLKKSGDTGAAVAQRWEPLWYLITSHLNFFYAFSQWQVHILKKKKKDLSGSLLR